MKGVIILLLLALASVHASVLNGRDLSNFQNELACDPGRVRIVRPRTLRDVQDAVARHDAVKASGAGHSWNRPFFCADAGAAADANATTAANIATTTLRQRSIDVDEAGGAVWVDAAVILADLLAYLAAYVTPSAPAGWTLAAPPWFVYQTVGGAVATGTHGSNLEYGSLSGPRQLLGLELVLADGSVRRFTPADSPFLFRALRVSVGRLGIIARVRLRIVREVPVARTLTRLAPSQFLARMYALQGAARRLRESAGPKWYDDPAALGRMPAFANDTEWFWIPQKYEFLQVSFARADDPARAPPLDRFKPDATTVFRTKGGALALGELKLPADAELGPNLTAAVLRAHSSGGGGHGDDDDDGAPLRADTGEPARMADGGGGGGANATAGASDNQPYAHAAAVLAALNATAISAPVPGLADGAGSADAARGEAWQVPKRNAPSGFYGASNMAEGTNEVSRLGINQVAGNATLEAAAAYIKQPNTTLQNLRATTFDQYEVSFPLEVAGDCVAAVLEAAYSDGANRTAAATTSNGSSSSADSAIAAAKAAYDAPDAAARGVDRGFRTAPLIRVVGAEDGLLAQTHDGPRVFVNLEDYLTANARRANPRFRAVMAALVADERCTRAGPPRWHWGKAGWPERGCWRGDEMYGDNWCDFGCAVRALDPTGKFRDLATGDRWQWAGVDLAACCGPNGFDTARPGCVCAVQHARAKADCPPAPYYPLQAS